MFHGRLPVTAVYERIRELTYVDIDTFEATF